MLHDPRLIPFLRKLSLAALLLLCLPALLLPNNLDLPAPAVFTQAAGGDDAPSRIVRLERDGTLRVLTPDFHAARDPEVSFDGKRILFAGRRSPGDRWQIFEMNADGSGVRRITSEPMDCRQPIYQSYFYVITADEPWQQISFVGLRPGHEPALYSTRLDGTALRRLTFNPYGATDPFLMLDGRMIFSSRQSHRLEPGPKDRAPLFGVNVDGTDYAIYTGNQGAAWKWSPAATAGGLVVFVENDQPRPDRAGWLAAVTVRRPLHSYRRLTKPGDGLYRTPAPLPDGSVLAARKGPEDGATYAIVRFDPATGAVREIFDAAGYDDIQPRLLAARPVPDGRSSVVNEQDPTGILYCLNVNVSDLGPGDGWKPGLAKRLRVIEGLPRPAGESGFPPPARRVLGEIPIEEDGSFNIRVPANVPIQLQLIDEHGLALRSCEWIWVKNKEPRGCIGCHEDGELTPENRMVQAVTKPSVRLTLPPERRRRVTFERDILPIFRAKCATAGCHGPSGPAGLASLAEVRAYVGPTARTSSLVWHLLGWKTSRPWDHPLPGIRTLERMPPDGGKPLTDLERRLILEWIDLGAE